MWSCFVPNLILWLLDLSIGSMTAEVKLPQAIVFIHKGHRHRFYFQWFYTTCFLSGKWLSELMNQKWVHSYSYPRETKTQQYFRKHNNIPQNRPHGKHNHISQHLLFWKTQHSIKYNITPEKRGSTGYIKGFLNLLSKMLSCLLKYWCVLTLWTAVHSYYSILVNRVGSQLRNSMDQYDTSSWLSQ